MPKMDRQRIAILRRDRVAAGTVSCKRAEPPLNSFQGVSTRLPGRKVRYGFVTAGIFQLWRSTRPASLMLDHWLATGIANLRGGDQFCVYVMDRDGRGILTIRSVHP
jgi:hypothetical protein